MKTSIAMCTYNGAAFIQEQLQSIVAQSVLPDELIICDDCSTDSTLDLIESFAKTAVFPVRFHRNEVNRGYTKNFEKAISLCRGEIIFLSDQDDVWATEKIELTINEFNISEAVGLVISDSELVDINLNPLNLRFSDLTLKPEQKQAFIRGKNSFDLLLEGGIVSGSVAAIRADLLKFILPFPSPLALTHDEWIGIISAIFSEIGYINKPLIKYRQHDKQLTGITKQAVRGRISNSSRSDAYKTSIQRYESKKEICLFVREKLDESLTTTVENQQNLKKYNEMRKQLDLFEENLEKIISHYKVRETMPSNRFQRIPLVVAELRNKNYHNYSRGLKSAILDIVERIP